MDVYFFVESFVPHRWYSNFHYTDSTSNPQLGNDDDFNKNLLVFL